MNNLIKKFSFVLLAVLITGGGVFILSRKPKTIDGVETISDQGRNHVPDGTAEKYNSNPPTSGSHYAEWEKPGIYDQVLEDGKLIHSLEHGYVIISYNCDKTDSVSEWKNSPDCQKLVEQIKLVTKKTGMDRLIVVPRLNLDTPIALTAWTKLMKLETVNEDQITAFVKEFRNHGPEKTME